RNGAEHIEKKTYPGLNSEPTFVAVLVNRASVDILENQIRFAPGSHSRIEQFRDVWMGHLAENLSFALEALEPAMRGHREVQEFDRNMSHKPPIIALGKPDTTHAALSNRREQSVGANLLTT